MSKVMLVEDDNNLREIYGARLQAEGYEIVAAKDGEEALALAVKEKPDLIICDIMMPKISGFDVLDILRGTPETKNTKIIVMTALSQAEDKAHANKLGADKYLVKSQVTLEDVVRVSKEVLDDSSVTKTPQTTPATTLSQATTTHPPATSSPQNSPTTQTANVSTTGSQPNSTPAVPPPPPDEPINTTSPQTSRPVASSSDQKPGESVAIPVTTDDKPANNTANNDRVLADAVAKISGGVATSTSPATDNNQTNDKPDNLHGKVIKPLNDVSPPKVDINELVAQEEAKERADSSSNPTNASSQGSNPSSQTVSQPNQAT